MRRFFVVLGLLVSSVSWARESPGFGGVRLAEGTVDFEGCLASPDCASEFYRFLGQGTLEQGFAMEGASVATSAVVNRHTGWIAGGLLHTFPFAGPRENLAGKEENTQFSPVFPKILGGKRFDRDGTHYAWGVTLLPPFPSTVPQPSTSVWTPAWPRPWVTAPRESVSIWTSPSYEHARR